jgi:NADH-quinone oxidoreductase subunit L
MTGPLMVLAAGSALAGWLGTPKLWNLSEGFRAFESWLEPVFAVAAHGAHEAMHEGGHDTTMEWALMGLSVAIALAGILLARYFYHIRTEIPDRIQAAAPGLHKLLYHKWYVDEIYDFFLIDGLSKGGGGAMAEFDRKVVDGGVNGAGWLTRFISSLSIWWDTWIVDGFVRLFSFSVKMLSYPVCILQTGRVQGYALFVVVGILVFFGYYAAR